MFLDSAHDPPPPAPQMRSGCTDRAAAAAADWGGLPGWTPPGLPAPYNASPRPSSGAAELAAVHHTGMRKPRHAVGPAARAAREGSSRLAAGAGPHTTVMLHRVLSWVTQDQDFLSHSGSGGCVGGGGGQWLPSLFLSLLAPASRARHPPRSTLSCSVGRTWPRQGSWRHPSSTCSSHSRSSGRARRRPRPGQRGTGRGTPHQG
jgi:hypothetical protein